MSDTLPDTDGGENPDELIGTADDLAQLKDLLLGPEKTELQELRHAVEQQELDADAVGNVLPDAILLRQGRDERLSEALAPTVEDAIQSSVQNNPKALADAIFPIMGPAIRKSITQAMASMVEGLNRTVEHSFTPRGLSWRLEALRTGRSFGEVVLLKSFVFRVEEVLLIHGEGAILLENVVAPSVVGRDPEMIASMLGVLHDYITESFTVGQEQSLQHVEFGDLVLEVVRGPQASLVAAVRGTAPRSLRERMQEALEEVHREKARDLTHFDGDVASFVTTQPLLRRCLEEERVESKPNPVGKLVLISLGLAVVLFGVIYAFNSYNARQRWQRAMSALEAEPGLVITTARRDGDEYVFSGLRDPLARDPLRLLELEAGIRPERVSGTWQDYHSLEPDLVLERVRSLAPPPSSARLDWSDGRLVASGRARHAWIAELATVSLAVSRETTLDTTELVDIDLEFALQAKSRLESQTVVFPIGQDALREGERALELILEAFQDLERTAELAQARVRIDLIGSLGRGELESDAQGLARRRAEVLREVLERSSSGWSRLIVSEDDERRPEGDVRLRVLVDPAG